MTEVHKAGESTVECRFIFDDPDVARVFSAAVCADARVARLSPAFRAYYLLRSLIPIPARQLLQRYRSVEQSPDWFIPREFVAALAEATAKFGDDGIPTIHPWPDGKSFAFVPTHDVETLDGMRNIERIANLEEDLGFRSSWNIVPHKYPVDRGLLKDLQSRGFEIGVHGYNHDGKLFTSRAMFDRRTPAINAALKSFDAVGFRAPMVHRNLEWLQALDVEYDASYFDTDPYQAMPGGIGSIWPFVAGKFVELPYTLPQDHTIFVALNAQDGQIWNDKLDFVAGLGGMALFITHPDYLNSEYRIDAYRQLLERARDMNDMWHALPREVAAWWRLRDESKLCCDAEGKWRVMGPAADRGRAAALRVATRSRDSIGGSVASKLGIPAPAEFEWRNLPAVGAAAEVASPTYA